MKRTGRRIIVESLAVVAILLPAYFFAERPRPTALSTALVLLLFFLPPALAAARLEFREGNLGRQALRYVSFGFVLGLLVGLVGGLEKAVLHLVTGEPFPIAPGLWSGVAVLFAFASGLGYGVMLGLVRGAGALLGAPPPESVASLFRGLPIASRWSGIVYSLIPGLGHFALGRPHRGRPFLLAAIVSGLCGLVIGIAGLILLVEGGMPTLPLLALGATLVLLPVALVFLSALDVLFLKSF